MRNYYFCGILFLVLTFVLSSPGLSILSEEDFVGYWLLDDGGGGEAEDGSGNEHHGTIIAGDWGDGQIGGALEFDGVGTSMSVEHSDDFNLAASMTLAAWARIEALPQQHVGIPRKEGEYVLHPTDAGGNGFNLRFYVGVGGWATPVISETVVDYGEWHHLAGTYDGSEVKVYIDGQMDKAQAQEGETTITQVPILWSNDCCGGRMLDGALDELAIINRALDEAEIQSLMDGIIESLSVEPLGKLAATWGDLRSR